ncbi:(d)CMP kinase [Candidatus Magnetomonas plexicatena]|uniref:(d)CMP kinase n=1 Tax=Candidatus Magnetomonas plexicatena TaxID=2552947 RepID=UPI001C74DDE1|nr:(d)CMP kinase [Nitrospirales bacterium LBB_01]
MPRKVIAIDGPAGAGKSTVAKELAKRLGYDYLDSGALYRAAALKLMTAKLDGDASDDKIMEILKDTHIEFSNGKVYLDRADVSERIRTPETGHYTSVFSTKKVVRDFLQVLQKAVGNTADLVAEGRDMATVVFPNAYRKFFITANEDIRAQRRFNQLNGKVSFTDALKDVRERDKRDSERTVAPLMKAPDAIEIDTSNKDIETVLSEIMRELA